MRKGCENEKHDKYIVVEPRSTREIEMIFKLIDKVPEVGNTADTPNPLGIHPFYKKFEGPH